MRINKEKLEKDFGETITDIKVNIIENDVVEINVFTNTQNNPYLVYYHKSQIENLDEYVS
jgi:hypothetical protein